MSLSIDTDRLRRILSASLPSGTRNAELFIESRIGIGIRMNGGDSDSPDRIEKRWEVGAHLRRFFEGRHESFVLDAPSEESLEALALHPEAVAVEWLGGVAPGVAREPDHARRRPAGAPPASSDGPWSPEFLSAATDLLREWLGSLAGRSRGIGMRLRSEAGLEMSLQEVLVVSTDRVPARDTRSFLDATLRATVLRDGRQFSTTETRSAGTLEDLKDIIRCERIPPGAHEFQTADLFTRAARGLEAVPVHGGARPVVFASPSGGFLLHEICGHLLEADHVLRGASPFVGARGRAIASTLLNMADDGSIEGMRGSALFDDEGVAARRTPLVIRGTLVGYLSDRLTSFATDGISTGNGRRQSYRDAPMPRMTNLVIDPGEETLEEILRRTPSGLLVTRLGRGSVDPHSGRFTLAVEEGFLIEGGRVDAPVSGGVLRGVASELLPVIDAVGSDAVKDTGGPLCVKDNQALPFGILQPTLRVSSMAVTGGGR